MNPLSYRDSGVDYHVLDAFKRACQQAAGGTVRALADRGLAEPCGVRGESAYLLDAGDEYLAFVQEGLGTKNAVADAMLTLTGKSFYRNIAIDTVATIVNDLVTSGALPASVAMFAAVAEADWFAHAERARDLAEGFAEGCRLAGAAWGGGETQVLRDLIAPGSIVLAGSAIGRIRPRSNRIPGAVRPGDAIVFLASSGVQTNGLTLCRSLSARLPRGLLTPIPGGRPFGEALLDPSVIYVRFVAACQEAVMPLHYVSHITGHGWRKLMRLDEPFVYRISELREPPAVFRFLMDAGLVERREAYATFNMGVGFAAYVDGKDGDRCAAIARKAGYDAWVAGRVEKEGARKAVLIDPLHIVFEGEELQVR